MLTGIDNLKAREHALKTGAQEFMSKDEVKKEEIYSNVRKVILEYKPDRLPPALGDNA